MSVGDVLAHYRQGEGLTALLGGMENATLDSISTENSARHTHTGKKNPLTLTTWPHPTAVLLLELYAKGQSRHQGKDHILGLGSFKVSI